MARRGEIGKEGDESSASAAPPARAPEDRRRQPEPLAADGEHDGARRRSPEPAQEKGARAEKGEDEQRGDRVRKTRERMEPPSGIPSVA